MSNVIRVLRGSRWLVLAVAFAGCNVVDAVEPKTLTAAQALDEDDEQAVCREPGARGTPLVVDWSTQDRMDLEEAMLDGVAVVEYRCGKLSLIRDCHIDGSYGFLGLSQREEVVQLNNVDEIRANLPLDGASIAAKFGAELERGRTLDLAMIHSGKLRTTVASATRDQLRGQCNGATHLIRGAFVGAFAMAQGTKGKVGTVAEVFEAGLRASSSSESAVAKRDGDPAACRGVAPGASQPPAQCTAAIRLELVAIGDASMNAGSSTPAELEAQIACPEGMVASGAKCTAEKAAPYRCSGTDANECRTQCERGDPSSCAILGSMYEGGYLVERDNRAATSFHDRACRAGVPYSCSRLGVMYFYGSGVGQDLPLATELFQHACSYGDGDGCNNFGMMLAMGSGIERERERAAELFAWSCNAGDMQGCFNAMVAHREGLGVPRNETHAREFGEAAQAGGIVPVFERNCAGGNAYSCWGLGYMHHHGVFKQRDLERAKVLYQLSCPGITFGCEALQAMGVAVPSR
ncbi:MAG: tetratricopeptide repeat protein [Enhygromyxa sp.]